MLGTPPNQSPGEGLAGPGPEDDTPRLRARHTRSWRKKILTPLALAVLGGALILVGFILHRLSGTSPDQSPGSASRRSEERCDTKPVLLGHERPRRMKILTPLALVVLGVAGVLIAILVLYPKRTAELPPPASSILAVKTTGLIDAIQYRVAQDSPAMARIIVSVVLPSGEPIGAVLLKVSPPAGISFVQCRAPACMTYRTFRPAVSIWTKRPTFVSTAGFLVANAEFPVKARSFGVTFNGVTAAAAIPEVIYSGPNNPGTVLVAAYRIPSAASYDWSSSFLSTDPTHSPTTFHERLPFGDTPARAAIGINHAAQAHDADMTFAAGILLGLAAGAILSAAQEFLHAFD